MEKKYVVYTINLQDKVMYVGCTNDFTKRRWEHLNKRNTQYSAIPIEIDLSKIEIKEITKCDTFDDGLKEEGRYITYYNTINNGWNKQNSGLIWRDREKEYKQSWEIKNREKRKEQRRKYQTEYKREYRLRKKAEKQLNDDRLA